MFYIYSTHGMAAFGRSEVTIGERALDCNHTRKVKRMLSPVHLVEKEFSMEANLFGIS